MSGTGGGPAPGAGRARIARALGVGALGAALLTSSAAARELAVAPGGTGPGTRDAPLGSVQTALAIAEPGDVVVLSPGVYRESVRSLRAGRPSAPVTLRSRDGLGTALLTAPGTVLRLAHAHLVIRGLVLDGQYGAGRTVDVRDGADHVVLQELEIRRSGRDCLRIRTTTDILVTDSLIHHCLNPAGGRTDAHGIVLGAARRVTVRSTEIHTFSGDAIQADPDRGAPGWTDLLIEACRFWLRPLPQAENGFPPGTVPGENAVDTKTWPGGERARLTVRDTTAWGFEGGTIRNMAAFNIKEQVDAFFDGVTVRQSEIAFRVRGPGRRGPGAAVSIVNGVIFDVGTAIRYEDDIARLTVWNTTIGLDVGRAFHAADSPETRPDVRNLLIAGDTLPRGFDGAGNVAAPPDVFVAPGAGDYRLADDASPVDGGVTLPGVATDRDGTPRPLGSAYDVGAFER